MTGWGVRAWGCRLGVGWCVNHDELGHVLGLDEAADCTVPGRDTIVFLDHSLVVRSSSLQSE